MSRCLLQLQEANQATIRVNADDPLHFSISGTPSFIHSIGAALNPDLPREVDEDLLWDLELRSCAELEEEAVEEASESEVVEPSTQA